MDELLLLFFLLTLGLMVLTVLRQHIILSFLDMIFAILTITMVVQDETITDPSYYIMPLFFVLLIQIVAVAVPNFMGGKK